MSGCTNKLFMFCLVFVISFSVIGCGDMGLGSLGGDTTSQSGGNGEGIDRDPNNSEQLGRDDDTSTTDATTDEPTSDGSTDSDDNTADEPAEEPDPTPVPDPEPEPEPDPVEGDPAAGYSLYRFNCQHCHGANGAGGSGPAIAGTSSSKILAIFSGQNDHTPFNGFSEADATDIAAYLNSVQ